MRYFVGSLDVDQTNKMPGGLLPEVIEDLVQAEGSMLAGGPGYESIAGHISLALCINRRRTGCAHDKLHES